MIGQFKVLKVAAKESIGVFLDWGQEKDLFLPFSEQLKDLKVGDSVVVYIYLDKADRPTATMRIENRLQKKVDPAAPELHVGQEVQLILYSRTDIGYKAIVNEKYQGLLYGHDVFQKLSYGQQIKGYVQKIREDGKIDIILQKLGHKAGEDIEPLILEKLNQNNGFLSLTAQTSAEEIYDLFGVSKKKYKIAIGGLYKKRLIRIEEDGIYLNPVTPT